MRLELLKLSSKNEKSYPYQIVLEQLRKQRSDEMRMQEPSLLVRKELARDTAGASELGGRCDRCTKQERRLGEEGAK